MWAKAWGTRCGSEFLLVYNQHEVDSTQVRIVVLALPVTRRQSLDCTRNVFADYNCIGPAGLENSGVLTVSCVLQAAYSHQDRLRFLSQSHVALAVAGAKMKPRPC